MRLLLRSAAATLAVFTACTTGILGTTYPDERALLHSLGDAVVIGAFDVHFPAQVVAIDRCEGAVAFTHRGTPQVYPGESPAATRVLRVHHAQGDGTILVRMGPHETMPVAPPR